MSKTIRHILKNTTRAVAVAAITMAMAASMHASAQNVIVNVSVDSTQLVMGDRTRIHVEVLKNGHAGTLANLPRVDQTFAGLDVIDVTSDSTALGNNRMQVNHNILVQAFDPGLITMEPFKVYMGNGDTVFSDKLTLKVIPVELSPELGDPNNVDSLKIHPNESVSVVKGRWYDVLPEMPSILSNPWFWVCTLLGLMAITGIVLYMLYRKNGKYLLASRKPPIPPYELAMMRLDKLHGKHLPERGEEKMYYTELTEILRQYLEGRFGINALEMSTTQIMHALRHNEETRMSADMMQKVLEIADFVKFAKVRPLPDDNTKAFASARSFIEETRPKPEPESENNDNQSTTQKK